MIQSGGTEFKSKGLARQWLGLSVISLLLAGCLSMMLVLGRVPPFSAINIDPLFFRRCLVVHVDLALIVWFFSFATALYLLLPQIKYSRALSYTPYSAGLGICLMIVGALIPGAEPVLANYVPVIDHAVFLCGLILFAISVVSALVIGAYTGLKAMKPITSELIPEGGQAGLKFMAGVVGIAFITFMTSWWVTPTTFRAEVYYEKLFWGGGHVLQVASVMAMVVVWMILLRGVLGHSPIGKKPATALFAILFIPQLMAPYLALQGTSTALYHGGFTRLMQFGIFPAVLVFIVLCLYAIYRAISRGEASSRILLDPRIIGFLASVALTLLGFVLGAMIRGSNTMIPAHYHAALGAITVSFMTVTFMLLHPLGLRLTTPKREKLAALQPVIFGIGQTLFALGFGLAGFYGLDRKAYSTDQAIRTTGEYVGLGVMGVGGLVAVVGGLLFLYVVLSAFYISTPQLYAKLRSLGWKIPKFIFSRS